MKTFYQRCYLVLLSLGTGLLGCTPSVDDYPQELAEAVCAWQHGCHQFERESDCLAVSDVVADPQYEYLRRAVAAGHVEYDRAAAAACLDAIRGQACEYDEEGQPEACKGVFRGLIERNGPCMTVAECAGDAVCGFDPRCAADTCCVGACRVFADPLKVGEACSFGGPDCGPEAFCATDPNTGQGTVCTARVKVGGVCSSGQTCAQDTYCDGSRCAKRLAPGESCEDLRDSACEDHGVCRSRNDGSVVCVVEAQLGAPCYQDIGCARFDSFCDEASRLCTLLPGPGQACASSECLPYAQCQDTGEGARTCVAWPEEGDACGVVKGGGPSGEDRYVECGASLECLEGVCKPPEALPPAMSCPVPEAG